MFAFQPTVAVKPASPEFVEFSRCDDLSWLPDNEQKVNQADHKADTSLVEKVESALRNGLLRNTDYGEIDVVVKEGVVFLSGYVITESNQQRVENVAREVPGIRWVISYLVPDDKLTREVAGALGNIEHEYGVKFFTGASNGVVRLHGDVGSAAVRSMAEKCAASIPGVRGVINAISAPGVNLAAEDQRFLQPLIGEQIYFKNGPSVKVQKVIINPNNQRVIAMVVERCYSNTQQDPKFLSYGEDHAPKRLVAIPISAMGYLTKSSGFLQIGSIQTDKYPDFDGSCFTAPEEGWTTPYPYCPYDVLLPSGSIEEMKASYQGRFL